MHVVRHSRRYLTQQDLVCLEILGFIILKLKRICIHTFINKTTSFLVLYQLCINSSSELKLPQVIDQHSCSE